MNKNVKKKVVVAMSGGVDSATSAFLLQEEGYEVIGVFMRLGIGKYKDEIAARKACQELGIRFYPVNLEDEFREKIIKYFLDSYSIGLTPNPCVKCNKLIKFGELIKVAKSMNAYLSTGHYVRVENDKGVYRLYRGSDHTKDQSYFLYNLTQDELRLLIFPLARLRKKEIKKIAKKNNIFHTTGESQDICFLNTGGAIVDHNEFLKEKIKLKKGVIKTMDGEIVGEHKGLPLYTLGQRRGVEIGGVGPFYVVRMDYNANILYVTNDPRDENLFSDVLIVSKINWISDIPSQFPFSCKASIRYGQRGEGAKVEKGIRHGFVVRFEKKQRAVTPGQSVVFYSDDEVIGGGVIIA